MLLDDAAIGGTQRPPVQDLQGMSGLQLSTSHMSPDDPSTDTPPATPRVLAGAGLLAGIWAFLPPYTGPALNTAARVEFADHVAPAIVVVAISALALVVGRGDGDWFLFAAGLGVVLAGFWMTATHVPLVVQAMRGEAPWGATVYHSVPGLAVLGLGVVWALSYRSDPAPEG